MGLRSPVHTMYQPNGCPECEHSGYRGRIAVYAVLHFDGMVRDAIHAETRQDDLWRLLKSVGFRTMQEDAIEKVAEGITSLEEVLRVVPVDSTAAPTGSCVDCGKELTHGFRFCPFCGVVQREPLAAPLK